MKTYLVTGCAGFIGSNFVHYMLEKYEDIRLVNLDKLTYAGNLENLQDIEDDARHIFVQGDICDKALVTDLIAKYDPDYVINFAAESHVDRSIKNPEIFVESNVLGTVNLLQCCKDAWYDADAKTWKEGKKYLQVSTDEVYGALGAEGYLHGDHPAVPPQPVLCLQGQRRYVRQGIPRHLRHADQHHPLLQQLRPLPVPREADPAAHQQRQAPQDAARLRRRYADPRLAVR